MGQMIKSKGVNLSGLIAYQKSSVVSKEIINKKTGTVTLFSFDKGQGLSEHKAPFDALAYILEGRAEITVSGKKHDLKGGEMVVMLAFRSHSVWAVEKSKMLLIMIRS